MPANRLYIAVSLDGYIADSNGGVGFLDAFQDAGYGYGDFIRGVDTVVMGRATYDLTQTFPAWPYEGLRAIVVTSNPPSHGPPGCEFWTAGVPALITALRRRAGGKDIYLCGGGRLVRAFLDAGAVDELELFIMPVLLGRGIPLFPPGSTGPRLIWKTTASWPNGVTRLVFGIQNQPET